MQKEGSPHNMKEEFKKFGWFVVFMYVFLQFWYLKQSPFIVARLVIAHVYLFMLPGFVLMLLFREKIEFVYRLLIGIGLGYATSILLTIYLNVILRVNIGKLYWISPILLLVLGFALLRMKR